jgi:23S rRNA (pseudouridine1915-N3)-methyltransferase
MSSEKLANQLQAWNDEQQHISIIIGGADGLADEIKKNANHIWALSRMTMPHGLARVMLVEQIYRAWAIIQSHPYHRK